MNKFPLTELAAFAEVKSMRRLPQMQPMVKSTFLRLSASFIPSSFKWQIFLAILVVICGFATTKVQAALLVGWEMSGLSSYGPSPFAPTTTDANLSAVGLTRGSGIGTSGSPAADGWGGNGFDTTSTTVASGIAANDFAAFSITAASGFTVSISDIGVYNIRRSSTGPTTGIWQYQVGAGSFLDIGTAITWGSTTSSSGNSQSSINLSGISDLQNVAAGTTITFRVVNWGASNANGTWYINNFQAGNDFTLNGTLTAVPEPTTWALGIFGAFGGLVGIGTVVGRRLQPTAAE